MRIMVYQVRNPADLGEVFDVFDSLDDHFLAGFENYPATGYTVVVGHGRELPTAVIVSTGGVITACVDRAYWDGYGSWEQSVARCGKLVERLRETHDRLIVHAADDDRWLSYGFVAVPKPGPAVLPQEPERRTDDANKCYPGAVYAWGYDSPDEVYAVIRSRGWKWPADNYVTVYPA